MSRIHAISGAPPLRRRPAGFKGLARVITAQQLSVASAAAIWQRLEARVRPFTPASFLAVPERDLRRAGLSRVKIATLRGLADAIAGGSLDLDKLTHAPEEEIHAELTTLKGIGPWTADIYMVAGGPRAAIRGQRPPLRSTPARASLRWSRSPKPGARGEASRRACFGRIMGRGVEALRRSMRCRKRNEVTPCVHS